MGNKRNTAVRVCEIVDGVLSAIWGVFCFVAIGVYVGMPILPEYGTIMTIVCILLFCMGCYNLIVGIYIAVKGCTVHGVVIAKIVISIIMFALTLLNLQASTFCFYLFWALFDFIMLYAVPLSKGEWDKVSESSGQESSVVAAPAPVLESSVTAPAQTGIQKYIMCPICHDTFIKESEKCCDRCRLEYERLEAASVLRMISAKRVFNGKKGYNVKEGYKLMDGKCQNVGIAIPDPSYTPKPPEHTAQTVHSDSTTTNAQKDYKEGNATVATGKSDPETWRSGMWGLGDEGMKQEYRKFLTKQGYKDTTVNAYVSAINKVKDFENTDWEGVYRNVKALCRDYDSYGPKAALGAQGHNTVISSLKQFHAFYYKNENKI